MPWPWRGPHCRVRRTSMSSVPWRSSRRSGSGVLAIYVDGLRLIRRPSTACSRLRASRLRRGGFGGLFAHSAALAHPLPEPFALVRTHVTSPAPARTPAHTKAAEQDATEREDADGLPERDLAQAK